MKIVSRAKNLLLALVMIVTFIAPTLNNAVSVHAAGINIVPNPSFETANSTDATLPSGWSKGGWGTNTSTLSYVNAGNTGSRAAKVDVSSYISGDAKWYFAPVTVTGSTQYTYSDYYQSTVASNVVAQFGDGTGNYTYLELGAVPVSSGWSQFSVNFSTTASTKDLTIFHLLRGVGSLTIDDVAITDQSTAPVPTPTPTPTPTPEPTPTPVPTPTINLISNPSAELNSSGLANSADGWSNGGWGTNTRTFSVASSAHTGSRALKVAVTGYSSGDAKWYFAPVAVTGSTTYQFEDYYIANVASRVVAQLDDGVGNYTYVEMATAPTASTWQKYTSTLTTSASTKKLTIFHLLSKAGNLTIDDLSLAINTVVTPPTPTPSPANLIVNPSLEMASGSQPVSWKSDKWGTNTALFNYVQNDGRTGTSSVKTTVTNYVSGDAKWYFTPLTSLVPNSSYSISLWYKTNTQAHIVAVFVDANGAEQYQTLPNPLSGANAATAWQQYNAKINVPTNAVSMTVFSLLSSNGWLQTDDYSLTPYTMVGLSTPIISLTFDDGLTSIYNNGLPLLKKYGLVSTQYLISGKLNTTGYMTTAMVKAFQSSGSEIGSHTVTHADLTKLTGSELTAELNNSQTTLRQLFGNSVAQAIASPYGSYNATTIAQIQQKYQSHRSTDVGYNSKDNFNPYNILVQNVDTNTKPAEVASWVAKAKADKVWLVLVYHAVINAGTADDYSVTPADLDIELSNIKASGIEVKTVSQALAIIKSQI